MDTITKMLLGPAAAWTTFVGIAGLLFVGLGMYWLFDKQARARDLAELTKKLDELEPSDPEYGAVRALYTSMMIDAKRWSFVHSGSGSRGDKAGADHSGGEDSGSGGGHH